MRRPLAPRLLAAGTTVALATAIGVTALTVSAAQAATGPATGFATDNGGTTGGAGGQTVRATTGTAIHAALCSRASSSTPITIQVAGHHQPRQHRQGVRRQLQHRRRRDRAQADQQRHDRRRRQRGRLRPARHPHPRVQQHHHPERDGQERQEVGLAHVQRRRRHRHGERRPQRLGRPRHPGGLGRGVGGLRRPLRHEGQHPVRDAVLQHPAQLRPRRPHRVQRERPLERLRHVPPQPVREHRLPHARCCAAASRTSTTTTT